MFNKNAIIAKKEEKLAKLKEQLVRVEESYSRALQAQSWRSSDGMSERSVNNANVGELYKQKCELERKIEQLEGDLDDTNCSVFRIGVMR